MAHDVFISHSSKDKLIADAVCAVLEAQGIRCWVAPRDILPGRNWGGSIVEAIHGAKAMVLIFSANSNRSEHITREVERAANRGIPIIPIRIENILPTDSLEYFLSSPHWLDAFPPPLDNHLQHLAQVVRQIVVVAPAEPTPILQPMVGAVVPGKTEAPNAAPVRSGRFKPAWLAAAAAFILLLGFGGWYFAVYQPELQRRAAPAAALRPAEKSSLSQEPSAKPLETAPPVVKPAAVAPGPAEKSSLSQEPSAKPLETVLSVVKPGAALPREFTVTVDPADAGARLWLGPASDVPVKEGRAVLKDLPDGEQELIVQAPGYQPLTMRVTVKDGRGSAEAKLIPVNGALAVTAQPGTTAFDEIKTKAERGDADAQYMLGLRYANGDGVAKDSAEAVRWYRKAADQGYALAQNNLGLMYATGQGVPKDSAEAVSWYRKAADQGYAMAQSNLGLKYASGQGVPKDSAEAVSWYRKAADQGYADAQTNLGLMYASGEGVPKDSTEAIKWLRKAADQGNAGGQYNLGVMYQFGVGVPKDNEQAVMWYRKAADQGKANAQSNLGVMYEHGYGVAKDVAEALRWYRKAADQGYALAQSNLGRMYANGVGVAKDFAEAMSWFRKAADQGNASGQFDLGVMHQNGDGVGKDSAEAVRWYRKAADQGYASAQNNLGLMYAHGEGVPKDEMEALAWYYLAAASGNETYVKNRDALELSLGRQISLAAQQRSKEILKEIEAARLRSAGALGPPPP